MAKVTPEIKGLNQTGAEWRLGLVGVAKSAGYAAYAHETWPCWRDHFDRPVRETMRFRVAPAPEARPSLEELAAELGG